MSQVRFTLLIPVGVPIPLSQGLGADRWSPKSESPRIQSGEVHEARVYHQLLWYKSPLARCSTSTYPPGLLLPTTPSKSW